MDENEIGRTLVDAAVAVHRELGPGLLESVYEVVLQAELDARGLETRRQVPVSIRCRDLRIDEGFRADLIIEDSVILELKSVETITRAHKKQLLTYLRLANKKLGFLLNFGAPVMKQGITRIANRIPD